MAPLVPGVTRLDVARTLETAMAARIAAIEAQTILFVKGAPAPIATERTAVDELVGSVRSLAAMAHESNRRYRLDIVGHTDADGPDEANVPLSRARAEAVIAEIDPSTVPSLDLVASGAGSTAPVVAGQNEQDNQRNRRIQIRVTLIGAR